MAMELCKPCMEKMRGEGKKLTVLRAGANQKVTCARCGRRRYGALYGEERKEHGKRK